MTLEQKISKLRRYAKRCGIKVKFLDSKKMNPIKSVKRQIKFMGTYNCQTRILSISSELKRRPFSFIYTFAHELGHALDFDNMSSRRLKWEMEMLLAAKYIMYMKPKVRKETKQVVREAFLEMERAASTNGEQILSSLGIKIPVWKLEYARMENLDTYQRMFGK
jgi:hypothetical protein